MIDPFDFGIGVFAGALVTWLFGVWVEKRERGF